MHKKERKRLKEPISYVALGMRYQFFEFINLKIHISFLKQRLLFIRCFNFYVIECDFSFFEDFRYFKIFIFFKNHFSFPLRCRKVVCITLFVCLAGYYFLDTLIFKKTQNLIFYYFENFWKFESSKFSDFLKMYISFILECTKLVCITFFVRLRKY